MKDRIYQVMKQTGMNQKEFSVQTGIATSTLSNIFTGRTSATLNHAQALHVRFPNLRMEWLMFGEGDMYKDGDGTSLSHEEQPDLFSGSDVDVTTPSTTPSASSSVSDRESTYQIVNNSEHNIGLAKADISQPREVIKYVDKPQRKIKEIRIFFDDGTYEVFSGGSL